MLDTAWINNVKITHPKTIYLQNKKYHFPECCNTKPKDIRLPACYVLFSAALMGSNKSIKSDKLVSTLAATAFMKDN